MISLSTIISIAITCSKPQASKAFRPGLQSKLGIKLWTEINRREKKSARRSWKSGDVLQETSIQEVCKRRCELTSSHLTRRFLHSVSIWALSSLIIFSAVPARWTAGFGFRPLCSFSTQLLSWTHLHTALKEAEGHTTRKNHHVSGLYNHLLLNSPE